jgi:thiol-disulfide isomerase/thioredoxin
MVRTTRPPNPLPASELRFTTLDGKPVSVAELRGRLVLLNFWLTTCPPCLEEMPSLLELASRFEHRKLTLLLVATDKKVGEIQAFLKQNPRLGRLGRNTLIVHDPGGVLAKRLGTEKFPETYLIDPDGRMTDRVIGGRDWSVPSVADCLYGRIP